MKSLLILLSVAAAVAAGFPLMRRLDAFLDDHVTPPDEEDDSGDGE